MDITIILVIAVLFLIGLLYFEKNPTTMGLLCTKPVVSVMFILTALNQNQSFSLYFKIMLVGLILCFIGDVCLIFMDSKKMFLAGLVAFLSGHIAYFAAFYSYANLSVLSCSAALIFGGIGIIVFQWLKSNLGTMKIPVIAYITIITVMIVGAVSVFDNIQLSGTGRYLILFGALFFYLSDLFVARNQFMKKAYINRLVGLPLYFIGQFLLAFSVAHIG